ncbi:hypothetical protein HFP57_06300 [Parasphingopyxis algicola]|uniref:M56 family metallopeptidase n=1 Tax=Parasphingopyxis algicola TaxID=2026624 RepID=UPI00159FBE0C|nr:M56 family metallopeptidase [Parasphingopyxis algicola]QLC24677.1 hypothetical protein HFP57_06300 [Parasphingopyxis algicola]
MTEWLLDTFVATSILMVAVLAVRAPVTRFFGARVAYALWLIPAARLLMPPITRTVEASAAASTVDPALAIAPEILAILARGSEATGPDWTTALITVWLAGAGLLFLWRISDHLRKSEEILADSTNIDRRHGIRLVIAKGVAGPIAFGIFRKCIAVPPGFYRDYSERERELALAHEYSHHRSGDLIVNFAAFLLLCLHWFNPIAWYAWRAFRFDQEAACDARVLAQTDYRERPVYGRAVAKASSGQALLFSSALDNPKSLKKRLKRMAMNDKSKLRRAAGLAGIGIGMAVALPMTATVAYAVAQAPDAVAAETRDYPAANPELRVVRVGHDGDHDGERRVYRFGRDGEPMSREELEAMIPDEAEIRAMIPSEEELRATIPSEAELREMVPNREELLARIPDIETLEQCHESGEAVHSEESTDPATGRQRLRLMICRERLAENARTEALEGLREARDEVAGEADMPADVRADVLATLDAQIANLSR